MEILNWNKKNVERRDKADYISSTNWYFRYPCLSSQLEDRSKDRAFSNNL